MWRIKEEKKKKRRSVTFSMPWRFKKNVEGKKALRKANTKALLSERMRISRNRIKWEKNKPKRAIKKELDVG